MFKRITPQTIADWGERIYIRFLELTKRFTSTQIMALLAIIVGVLAGLGTLSAGYARYRCCWYWRACSAISSLSSK